MKSRLYYGMMVIAMVIIMSSAVVESVRPHRRTPSINKKITSTLQAKNLAGPPSEFINFVLPIPNQVAQSSNSALIQVVFEKSQTTSRLEWISTIPVDTDEDFTLSVVSSWSGKIKVKAIPPKTACPLQQKSKPIVNSGSFGIDGNTIPSTSYTWIKPAVGLWTVTLVAHSDLMDDVEFKRRFEASTPQAFVLSANPSEFQIYTYLSSYSGLFVGENIPVLAMLTSSQEMLPIGNRPKGYLPTPIKLTGTVEATLLVTSPDGQSSTVVMKDDGLHADGVANDGVYGAFVQASEVGNYQTSVVFKGTGPDGDALFRTTQHSIPVTSEYYTLNGVVTAVQQTDAIELNVGVDASNTASLPDVRLYTEVWGVNDGQDVAIAWVGGVASLNQVQGVNTLSAVLDNRWIAAANATAPFSIRNTIVSDINTFVPVSNCSAPALVKMARSYRDVRTDSYDPPLNVITKQMRDGKMPAHLEARYNQLKKSGVAAGNGKLILVHGYCSDDNPWTVADFENAAIFTDYNQNRPNNDFAKLLGDFGAQFTDGFSVVGHSQGGLAALHLATYYHSGLDLSQALPGRVIQSVGSPYLGTALAGTLASIGEGIGIGCSSNNDMTTDGAALWLNSIPADKRALVYYTSTQYKTGGLINSCNLAANAVLSWPNDGVTDKEGNQLPGATYANHFKAYCHTTDMNSPPQCEYHANNQEMSSLSVW